MMTRKQIFLSQMLKKNFFRPKRDARAGTFALTPRDWRSAQDSHTDASREAASLLPYDLRAP